MLLESFGFPNYSVRCICYVFFRSEKDACTWLDPQVIAVVPYVTAGLKCLYTQVTSPEPVLDDGKNLKKTEL